MNKKEYNFFLLNIYIIWIVINLLLLLFVDNNTRISASADALSWITPAKNFFLNHNFIENTEYSNQAVYRTPIIPIIISFSFIFTENDSYIPFIILQIIATIFTSFLLIKLINNQKYIYKLILVVIFLFNPNILSTTHLIQSEIFTMLFFTLSFYFIAKHKKVENKLINAFIIGIFLGMAILARPSIIFIIFLLPIILYLLYCKSFKNIIRIEKNFNILLQGFFSLFISLLILFPWAYFVKSIEGNYTITSAESRYRFVWDQAIYAFALSENISYKEALLKTERSKVHQLNYIECDSILDNSVERANCFNKLTKDGYKLFFSNPIEGHIKAFTRSIVQFFISGGGQNFTNLMTPVNKKKLNNKAKDWKNKAHKRIMLFYDNNNLALVNTIITVTYATIMRIMAILGLIFILKRKKYAYVLFILGVLIYFASIHIYHGSSRYRVPIEPILVYLSFYGFLFLKKFKKAGEVVNEKT